MRNKSNKFRVALTIVSSILCAVLLGGVIASVVTKTTPLDWFKEDDVIVDVPVVDEPVLEEVLPLAATTEEEMNTLLVEENVGKIVQFTGETVKNVDLPYSVGDTLSGFFYNQSFDMNNFVVNLDWDNSHGKASSDGSYRGWTGNYVVDYIFLVTNDNESIDSYKYLCANSWSGGSLTIGIYDFGIVFAYRLQYVQDGISCVDYYVQCLNNKPYFSYKYQDGVLVEQSNFFEIDNYVSLDSSKDLVIDYIDDSLLGGDGLFFGFNDGEYGSVEIIFEKDTEYLIVANESDEGFHFEKL